MYIYIRKLFANDANGNQISFKKDVATHFFQANQEFMEKKHNMTIHVFHFNQERQFVDIELQPATDYRISTRLNSFLSENGDEIEVGDLLYMEKIGKSYGVRLIKESSPNYKTFEALLNTNDRHLLICTDEEKAEDETGASKQIESNLGKPYQDLELSYSNYLTAMRTKPFLLLAGISGTGKSRIVKEMAFASCPPSLRKDDVTPGNYCMIEVKPNWHDSTELIGYVSSIPQPHYVVAPFINFLIKAMHNPKAPFFVCLDEMNLAPVEQYFAEFLSVLESRKLVNGEIVSEPIIKSEYFSKYYNDFKRNFFKEEELTPGGLIPERYADLWKELGDNGLRLPPNVIVVGTVNMDETTYQFSRKVIDRAMTIEMNDVNFDSMFGDNPDTLKYRGDDYVKAVNFLPKFTAAKDALTALDDADRKYLKENVPAMLKALDAALANTPFRIAYRVENELILYFAALRDEQPEATSEALLSTAIDDILMMKVLPRIEGNEDDLAKPLERLKEFAVNGSFEKAITKLKEMHERLKANHFTSFWP